MAIERLQTFLVHPNKSVDERRAITGAEVALEGQVFDLLTKVYMDADRECRIDISFNHAADGRAENDCRNLLLAYAGAPSVATGRPLAERLGGFTNNRSGLGLLFLATGMLNNGRKTLIARFAANNGILADENPEALNVQFIERVFLRSVKSFKAAVYQDTLTPQAYWTGRVVDRQIGSRDTEVSRYWITEFLASDFRTTSAQGTRVLAVALKNALKKTDDPTIKRQITAAATLGPNLNDQVMTAGEFLERMGLNEAARGVITAQLRHEGVLNDQFRFSGDEFTRQLSYTTIELNNGAMLSAMTTEFDQVFGIHDADDGQVTYRTTGRIVRQKLDKVRS